jgi:hypothetical protein
VDQIYASLGISAQAMVGRASEIMPEWAGWVGAIVILGMSVKPIWRALTARFKPATPQGKTTPEPQKNPTEPSPVISDCDPT